jgi:hypothetical protein
MLMIPRNSRFVCHGSLAKLNAWAAISIGPPIALVDTRRVARLRRFSRMFLTNVTERSVPRAIASMNDPAF